MTTNHEKRRTLPFCMRLPINERKVRMEMDEKKKDSAFQRQHDFVVLYGGESEEREVSLNSGKNIAAALKEAGIEVDLYDWNPLKMADFLTLGYKKVFIALHGGTGENGMVQAMLEMAGIPYTGVRMRAASICMDKCVSKTLVMGQSRVQCPKCVNIPVSRLPHYWEKSDSERWNDVEALGYPLIVKPARNGSSVGVTWVESREEIDEAVRRATLSDDEMILFEQCIQGHELTVAVLNGKALGVCRIIPKTKFYDYEAKYNRDDTEYLTPSQLGDEFDSKLCRLAEEVALVLNCCDGVVRIDFLADRQLNPYFLEANTVPGMTSHSLVPKIARQAGIPFPELCRMILDMAK